LCPKLSNFPFFFWKFENHFLFCVLVILKKDQNAIHFLRAETLKIFGNLENSEFPHSGTKHYHPFRFLEKMEDFQFLPFFAIF